MGRIGELEKHGSSDVKQKLHGLQKNDGFFARDGSAPLGNIPEKMPAREPVGLKRLKGI